MQELRVISNNTYVVEITSEKPGVKLWQRGGDIYVSHVDDVLNGVVKISDILISIDDKPITNMLDLNRLRIPFVMQLHPIENQRSSYINCTRLNDIEAYNIVNQRFVQVNERLQQQRIDEELVCQQLQPIDREAKGKGKQQFVTKISRDSTTKKEETKA